MRRKTSMVFTALLVLMLVAFGAGNETVYATENEIENTTEEESGDTFVTIDEDVTLSDNENKTITLPEACWELTGDSSNGWILQLQGNIEITGDLYITAGKLTVDLAGHTLKINGSLYQPHGVIDINGGTLEVGGDYRIQMITKNGGSYADNNIIRVEETDNGDGSGSYAIGYLVMDDDKDYVKIGRSFYNQNKTSGNDSFNVFSAGTMEVGGNFYQLLGTSENFNATGYTKDSEGNITKGHTVYLNGSGQQIVHFDSPADSGFNNLVLTNTNVVFETAIRGWTLQEATTKFDNGLENGFYGTFDLNSKKLTINGNLYQPQGKMLINGGTLEIIGDYRLQTMTKNENDEVIFGDEIADEKIENNESYDGSDGGWAIGYLVMKNESDKVIIGGSFYNQNKNSGTNSYNQFSAGTMEIGGNFYQYNGAAANFDATGTHKVVLNSSTKQQIVHFDSPLDSGFADLELESTNVVFETAIRGWEVTRNTTFGNGLENGMTGEFKLSDNVTLTIDGNFYQDAGTMNLGGGKLTVTGDYRLQKINRDESGKIIIEDGEVSADPTLANILMVDPDNVVTISGSFYNQNYAEGTVCTNQFTAGKMTIGGDFYQFVKDISNADNLDNFNAAKYKVDENNQVITHGHTVILTGEREHIVHFDSPANSGFGYLEVEDGGSVKFDTAVRGWELKQDMIFVGGLPKGMYETFDLAGHILTIAGDLNQIAGTMNINGGTLIVEGNYRLQNITGTDENNANTYDKTSACLVMTNENDKVFVKEGFYNQSDVQSSVTTGNQLTAGTLTIGGDFYQLKGNAQNFNPSGTHLVILNGTKTQTVHFDSPYSEQGSGFYNLVLDNPDVVFETAIRGWTLKDDITFVNGLPNGMVGTFNLDGHTLKINGDFCQSDGSAVMNINGGRLEVDGDYIVAKVVTSDGKTTYNTTYANIVMENDADYIKVTGSFHYNYADAFWFNTGTMEIGGDFYQYNTNKKNFIAQGRHTVILNGSKQQIVSFELKDEKNRFNNLVLTKDKDKGYSFITDACWNKLYQVTTQVSISADNYVVKKGNSQQFTKTVAFTEAPISLDDSVIWSVSGNTSEATIIDATGLLTIGADESSDTVTVTATSVLDSTKSASAEVLVEKLVSVDSNLAKLTGHSLSLNGNIAVNFYMELSEEVVSNENAYMHFTLPTQLDGTAKTVKVKVSEADTAVIDEKTYYVFTCEVSAKEMTGEIKAQMFADANNAGEEYTYTVKRYADYILSHTDTYGDKVTALVKAMLNYGAYSQIVFDYNADKLANAFLLEEEKTLAEITPDANWKAVISSTDGGSDLASFGATLVLKSQTALNVYVKLKENLTLDDVTFYIDDVKVDKAALVKNGEYYVLTVSGIKASSLDETHIFKVENENKNIVLTYGPMSYCYTVLNGSNETYEETLKNVVSALYYFNQAANNYVD